MSQLSDRVLAAMPDYVLRHLAPMRFGRPYAVELIRRYPTIEAERLARKLDSQGHSTRKPTTYSFCEALAAGSNSRWHIRPLTSAGKKLSGGADTSALCGLQVAWDVNCDLSIAALEGACSTCAKIHKDRQEI